MDGKHITFLICALVSTAGMWFFGYQRDKAREVCDVQAKIINQQKRTILHLQNEVNLWRGMVGGFQVDTTCLDYYLQILINKYLNSEKVINSPDTVAPIQGEKINLRNSF